VIAGNNSDEKAMPLRHGLFAFGDFSLFLEICSTIPTHEPQQKCQQHRPNDSDENADDQPVLPNASESQVAGQEPANQRTDQADYHIHEEAESRSLHEFSSNPTSQQSNDDPSN
jgi:hypothetical protein